MWCGHPSSGGRGRSPSRGTVCLHQRLSFLLPSVPLLASLGACADARAVCHPPGQRVPRVSFWARAAAAHGDELALAAAERRRRLDEQRRDPSARPLSGRARLPAARTTPGHGSRDQPAANRFYARGRARSGSTRRPCNRFGGLQESVHSRARARLPLRPAERVDRQRAAGDYRAVRLARPPTRATRRSLGRRSAARPGQLVVGGGGTRGRSCCSGRCQDRHSAASCGGLVGRGLSDVLRTFGIEVLVCPKCSGVRRVLAAIHEPGSIARVLGAMGLASAVTEQAGCRSPPAAGEVVYVDEGAAE